MNVFVLLIHYYFLFSIFYLETENLDKLHNISLKTRKEKKQVLSEKFVTWSSFDVWYGKQILVIKKRNDEMKNKIDTNLFFNFLIRT